ncbi:Phospholipase/Carboxylesterase-domain-containing protein [Mycena capillaripes]|nr:Phospholipase/Carboxylesterase-domain-containing protein [Mycena capillaripes]
MILCIRIERKNNRDPATVAGFPTPRLDLRSPDQQDHELEDAPTVMVNDRSSAPSRAPFNQGTSRIEKQTQVFQVIVRRWDRIKNIKILSERPHRPTKVPVPVGGQNLTGVRNNSEALGGKGNSCLCGDVTLTSLDRVHSAVSGEVGGKEGSLLLELGSKAEKLGKGEPIPKRDCRCVTITFRRRRRENAVGRHSRERDPDPAADSKSDSSAVVIFLHGLGDTPRGFPLDIVDILRSDPALGHVKWILPAAPVMSVTGNLKKRMPSWFDIYSFHFPLAIPAPGEEDEAGMLRSITSIDALLNEVVTSGVDPSRIVLGGISQGGAMALLTGLTTATKVAGLIVLSGRLPLRNKFKAMVSLHASSIPIFWGHGTADPLVKYEFGRVCADYLMAEIGIPAALHSGAPEGLDFHTYEGLAHDIRDDELDDLSSWLKKILPSSGSN